MTERRTGRPLTGFSSTRNFPLGTWSSWQWPTGRPLKALAPKSNGGSDLANSRRSASRTREKNTGVLDHRQQMRWIAMTGHETNAEYHGSRAILRFLLAERFQRPQARGPVLLNHLARARERQCIHRHVAGNHRAGTDIGAVADLDRRNQRRIGTDECILADRRAVLGAAVVIAGDGAGADIGIGADRGVADIA